MNFHPVKGNAYEFYNMGLFAPSVVLLDDDLETIISHKNYLLDRNISAFITRDHKVAIEAYERHGNTAAYAFDNHMSQVKQVGSRGTVKGLAVGLAVVSHLTNDGTENIIKHCATISNYTTEPEAQEIYDVLAHNGQHVEIINKHNMEDFARFVEKYRQDFRDNIEYALVSQNLDAIRNSYGKLSESDNLETEVAAMMGYVGDDVRKWLANQTSIIQNCGSDIKERIEALAYILHGLILHFDERDDQAEWIHQERVELGNKSPWKLLTSGDLTDIYMVASFVNHVFG